MNTIYAYLELMLTERTFSVTIMLATFLYTIAFFNKKYDSAKDRFASCFLYSLLALILPATILIESIVLVVLNSIDLPHMTDLKLLWNLKSLSILYLVNPITLELGRRVYLKYSPAIKKSYTKNISGIRKFRKEHFQIIFTLTMIMLITSISTTFMPGVNEPLFKNIAMFKALLAAPVLMLFMFETLDDLFGK